MALSKDDVKRIVNQCQLAEWIAQLDYKTPDRKTHQRWTVTQLGREFAGLMSEYVPTGLVGMGEQSAHKLAHEDGTQPTPFPFFWCN